MSAIWSPALFRAADDAEREADGLLEEAKRAMIFEDETDVLYAVATDAIEAWRRAERRARKARQLADHIEGVYNAFEESA